MEETDRRTVHFQIQDGVGHLILNLPPANKMTLAFFEEFNKLVSQVSSDPVIKALVISGNGRHFSSGADLSVLLSEIERTAKVNNDGTISRVPDFMVTNYQSFLKLEAMNIPVISAIRGVCLGSALELALFSHYRFCGEDAVFGLPEASFNLIPGLGGIRKMTALAGKANALELILRGKTFSAEDALKIHVVDRILPKRGVVDAGLEFAHRIKEGYRKEKKIMYLKKFLPV
ncbi:MAG: enoyl-CoA hydratase/isomerase family protein [Bacteroidota bacterium]